MKKSIFILLISTLSIGAFSANNENPNKPLLWATIEKCLTNRTPETAKEPIEKLKAILFKEKTTDESAKLLIYQMKFAQMNEEKSLPDFIKDMENELPNGWFPYTSILHSMLAESYLNYFNQNRYSYYNRKIQAGSEAQEIENLTEQQLFERIKNHINKSTEQPTKLIDIPLTNWTAIIEKGTKPTNYRDNAYDFLAWRAVDLLQQCTELNSRPNEEFNNSQISFFANPKDFANYQIQTTDSLNNNFLAISILQDITRSYENSTKLEKKNDSYLQRILKVKEMCGYQAIDSLYSTALFDLDKQSKGQQINNLIKYYLALYYKQLYSAESLKKALELCRQGYSNFPKSEGGINCKALETEIQAKSINLITESTYAQPNKISGLIDFKNLNKLYARIYKKSKSEVQNDFDDFMASNQLIREFEIKLNAPQDYLSHNQEFETEALAVGQYAIVLSANSDFKEVKNIRQINTFNVTNIFVIADTRSPNHQFLILNRKTGKPISNAEFKLTTYSEYSFRGVATEFNTKSNSEGEIVINTNTLNISYKYTVKLGADELNYENSYEPFGNFKREQTIISQQDFLFTDRKIYRPGQPIYYKSISFKTDQTKASAIEGQTQKISLHDMNGKIIATQTFTTNKYGSVSGMFTLPTSVLNGNWYISSNENQTYFSVEEYVRPKFKVLFLPIKGMYLGGDTAIVEGQAISYTQMQMQNCKVKFKIIDSNSPIPLCKIIRNKKEIIENIDETTTDKDGRFSIQFKLPKSEYYQDYTIEAEVFSPTGEVIAANTTFSRKNNTLCEITLISKENYEYKTNKDSIKISCINHNGSEVEIPIEYKIYSLNTDLPLKPEKLWKNQIDTDVTTNELPIEYNGVALYKLSTKKLILNGLLKSNEHTISTTVINSLKPGVYRLMLNGIVQRGDSVSANGDFTIIDTRSNNIEKPTFLDLLLPNKKYEANDTLRFNLGSSLIDAELHYQIIWADNKTDDKKWIANNSKTLIEVPIPSTYSGNIKVKAFTVSENRSYHQSQTINIESSQRKLNLKLTTFRDKIMPNSKEKWQIQVKDQDKKLAPNELLVTMYDASLDAFAPNYFYEIQSLYSRPYINREYEFQSNYTISGINNDNMNEGYNYSFLNYPTLNWYGFNTNNRGRGMIMYDMAASPVEEKSAQREEISFNMPPPPVLRNTIKFSPPVIKEDRDVEEKEEIITKKELPTSQPPIRKNLQETAFFLPHINSDSTGIATFSFTAPEALTTWKLLAFAHTTEGKSGTLEFSTTTQKELMVAPHMPRFLYQNDRILLKASISRLSNTIEKGKASLYITDEEGKDLNSLLENSAIQEFTFGANNTISISWWINIKDSKNGLYVKTIAESEHSSDGEQRFLPILSSKTRVVESLPFYAIDKGTKKLTFNKLKDNFRLADNRKLTISYTQNASWEVIKSLPYLLEGTDENSDELFNRYYANALTTNILAHNTNIATTIENWSHETAGNNKALTSNLQLNEEAKSVQLDQTPWLNEGKNETEARKRLVSLLNQSQVQANQANTLSKLLANQMANGAWPWFKGMEASPYITKYIAKGLIEMARDSVDSQLFEEQYWNMVINAVNYCDNNMIDEYNKEFKLLNNKKKDSIITPSPSLTDIEYLATRKLVPSVNTPKELMNIETIYQEKVKNHWTDYTPENQALIAQWFFRNGDHSLPTKIMESLYQCAIKNPEMGNYYKRESNYGYFRNDIEKHSNILKAFAEIGGYNNHVKLMQLYLIQQKRTNSWESNKATASAIGALLLGDKKWLASPAKSDKIFVGKNEIIPDATETGTGSFTKTWYENEITPALADIKIEKNSSTPSWGAMTWDYSTEINNIETNNQNPLTVNRDYFKVNETLRGIEYEAITTKSNLKIGDKIMIRLTIKTDRPMEYIHLKDNRPASVETMEVFSGYNYNGGAGYYQNMKDASSNFYMSYLPKGIWKVEYTTRVSQVGLFRSGICTVQCYYAPEFQNQTKAAQFESKE